MMGDLAFASGTRPLPLDMLKPLLMDATGAKPPLIKNCSVEQNSQPKRRPRPVNLVRAGDQSQTPRSPVAPDVTPPLAPRPPPAAAKPSNTAVRPPSSRQPAMHPNPVCGNDNVHQAVEMPGHSEIVHLRYELQELQKKYEKQSEELSDLQLQQKQLALKSSPRSTSIACEVLKEGPPAHTDSVVHVEQACQTEESSFDAQLDQVFREGAQKTKEMRKLNEVVQTLRAELQEEKLMSGQFRDQVEVLEDQLKKFVQSEQRARAEQTLSDWHVRQSEKQSRSSTPQQQVSRTRNAWEEANSRRSSRSTNGEGSRCVDACSDHGPTPTRKGMDNDQSEEEESDENESSASGAESAVSSDCGRDVAVFHPKKSLASIGEGTKK